MEGGPGTIPRTSFLAATPAPFGFATSCYQLDTYRYENFVTNGRPAEVTFLLEHVWRITSDLG